MKGTLSLISILQGPPVYFCQMLMGKKTLRCCVGIWESLGTAWSLALTPALLWRHIRPCVHSKLAPETSGFLHSVLVRFFPSAADRSTPAGPAGWGCVTVHPITYGCDELLFLPYLLSVFNCGLLNIPFNAALRRCFLLFFYISICRVGLLWDGCGWCFVGPHGQLRTLYRLIHILPISYTVLYVYTGAVTQPFCAPIFFHLLPVNVS